MNRFVISLLIAAVCSSGCFLRRSRVVDRVTRKVTGPTGWYRVTPLLVLDRQGNSELPPRPDVVPEEEEEDFDEDLPFNERLESRFKRQLSPLLLDQATPCMYLTGSQQAVSGPVYIFVHGIGGIGHEWWPVVPTLDTREQKGMFFFRWSATQTRETILGALVMGLDRITACFPRATPIVLAHSAGGVIMSFAAGRLTVKSGQTLEVLTVASPLAGIGYKAKGDAEDDDTRFFNDLGSSTDGYPMAAANVWVTHFRTQFPGDQVMKPNMFGHAPNVRGIGVKGASEIDLPEELTHNSALIHVARRLLEKKKAASSP